MRDIRLLVLEDDANIGHLIAEVCQLRGNIETHLAITGKAGLLLLEKETFDYMLLDLSLPDISGFDFYQSAIKSSPQLKNRCLLMSGHLSKGKLKNSSRENDIRFLQKPFSLELFLEVLDTLTTSDSKPVASP